LFQVEGNKASEGITFKCAINIIDIICNILKYLLAKIVPENYHVYYFGVPFELK